MVHILSTLQTGLTTHFSSSIMDWAEGPYFLLNRLRSMALIIYPIPISPYMTKKIFLPYPYSLGPCEALPHSVKLNFLLICLQLLQLFLIKPVLIIKIYLKLQINLFYLIKLIFSKNWIILLKCLTRQYHNKNKNLKIQNQRFNSI